MPNNCVLQTHKFYGDQKHTIEDEEFAADIHQYNNEDREILLNGGASDYFFFRLQDKGKMSSKSFSRLFADSMEASVGQRITPQVDES